MFYSIMPVHHDTLTTTVFILVAARESDLLPHREDDGGGHSGEDRAAAEGEDHGVASTIHNTLEQILRADLPQAPLQVGT